MNKQLRADLMLVFVTFSWGSSFYLIDLCLEELGPLMLLSYRFLPSFIIVYFAFFKRTKKVDLETIKFAFTAGAFLALAYLFSVYGVMYTSLTNSAFLCATGVLFTPILAFIFKKHSPGKKFVFVVIFCTIGMGLLTLGNNLTIAIGDLYCLLCAITFSVNLLIVETGVRKKKLDPLVLGIFMLGAVGVFLTIAAFVFEKPSLPKTPLVWGSMLFLTVFCTATAVIIQTVAQKDTTASHVGLIYTLEPIFASVVAYIFAGEVLTTRGYIGAAMMIASIFIMEIDFSKLFRRKIA